MEYQQSPQKGHRHSGHGTFAASIARFQGSFVRNQLDECSGSAFPQNKLRLDQWVTYLRQGWTDGGVWKSAVSKHKQNCRVFIIEKNQVHRNGGYLDALLYLRPH